MRRLRLLLMYLLVVAAAFLATWLPTDAWSEAERYLALAGALALVLPFCLFLDPHAGLWGSRDRRRHR